MKNGFPLSALFLDGNHLGPMAWKNKAADSAMAKAETLVRNFFMAGLTKIHHDVSMLLAGDDIAQGMDPAVVASRLARLAAVCEQSYALLHTKDSKVLPF